jgi:hypothetical protein
MADVIFWGNKQSELREKAENGGEAERKRDTVEGLVGHLQLTQCFVVFVDDSFRREEYTVQGVRLPCQGIVCISLSTWEGEGSAAVWLSPMFRF